MSGEFLFELVEKAHWSFERNKRSADSEHFWSWENLLQKTLGKFFRGSSPSLSISATNYLDRCGSTTYPVAVHLPSNRVACLTNTHISVVSLVTSDVLLTIPVEISSTDSSSALNCLAWSNNGKLLAYGHYSGLLAVYSSDDGQLVHELAKIKSNRREDSFVEIWFSGSDGSQFIDLLCLKRDGQLNRYVMSRDDVASCAQYSLGSSVTCALIDLDEHQLYVVSVGSASMSVWKIVDTSPSLIKQKQIDGESEIYRIVLSSNRSRLASFNFDGSIDLFANNEIPRHLARFRPGENRASVCDLDFWDEKTMILFYSDGSMGFHEAIETMEEVRFESCQLNRCPYVCHRWTQSDINQLLIVDGRETSSSDSGPVLNVRLILIEHSDPCRLIDRLSANGEYGEALRVCRLVDRNDLADSIHEQQLRLSSNQLNAHLIRIQSRLRVLQLCTTLVYPTIDEQFALIDFALQKATRKQFFDSLSNSDQPFHRPIADENPSTSSSVPLNDNQLTITQKQVLLYRRRLLDDQRKLNLLYQLTHQCPIFSDYQSDLFEKWRQWDDKEIAQRCAREGQIHALKLVLDNVSSPLSSSTLLSILDQIPESVPFYRYEDLIPLSCSPPSLPTERRNKDWSDQYLSPIEIEPAVDRSSFIDWYHRRILSMEMFGFIDDALRLCQRAIEIENFEQFSTLHRHLVIELLLNKFCRQDRTLDQVKEMNEDDLIEAIWPPSTETDDEEIERHVQRALIPCLQLIDQPLVHLKQILMKKIIQNINMIKIIRPLKHQFDEKEFDDLLQQSILHIDNVDRLSLAEQLLTLMSNKQELGQLIQACRLFNKWSISMTPSQIVRTMESEDSLSNSIVLLIRSATKEQMGQMNISCANELLHDIEQICGHRLSSQTISNLFVSSLLKSDSIECIQVVRANLSRSHIPLILQAARDYIDSAKNSQDRGIALAKDCLDLIDDPILVSPERDLIEAQKICDFFHYPITPLEIRRHRNPIELLRAILDTNPQAYKNTSKMLSLASHLAMESGEDKQARCMLLIGEHSLKIHDVNLCVEVCSYLIEIDYGPAWKCCWSLIKTSKSNMKSTSFLSFVALHCDEILLEDVLHRSINIRNQLIPSEEFQASTTYCYCSNPFYDRDYSQQVIFKEIPLMKSPPIDVRTAATYVNIDTPLSIVVYLSSDSNNEFPVEKNNEYSLQLSIYSQTLMNSPIPRDLQSVPSSLISIDSKSPNAIHTRLVSNRECSLLHQIDSSIDYHRFTLDPDYRRSTILGLFMSDNPPLSLGEQLAIKYELSLRECQNIYLEYLLINSNLSLNEIRKRIRPLLMADDLKKNRQIKLDLVKRLHTNVFPLIDGRDFERLRLFYDIKKNLGDSTHAQRHIEAIQQLRYILRENFDYKLLLSSPEKFLDEYVNEENLASIASALDQVKVLSSNFVTSSSIYSRYLSQHPSMFTLLTHVTSADDYDHLVDQLISPESHLSIHQRIELLDYSLKCLASKQDEQWIICQEKQQHSRTRLVNFSKFLSNFSETELNRLEKCQKRDEQEELLSQMLSIRGQCNMIIDLRHSVFPDISIPRILTLTIEKMSANLQSGDETSLIRLDRLLESISNDRTIQTELFSCLQQIWRNEQIDRRVRFKIIGKLDKMFDEHLLHSDDLLLVEQYRLSTLLSSFDSFTELTKDQLINDEDRCRLFETYLIQATRSIHFECLIKILLDIWSKRSIHQAKGSHGLTLKSELFLAMIEKGADWRTVLVEKSLDLDEEALTLLIKHLFHSENLSSFAYKIWLIHPIESLVDLLFRSSSPSMFDDECVSMSIEYGRVCQLLGIDRSLFDLYLSTNLSREQKLGVIQQLKNDPHYLLHIGQMYLHLNESSPFVTLGLIVDVLQQFFIDK